MALENERRLNPLFRKPGAKAIYTCLNNFRHCVEEAGLTGDSPVTEFFNRNTVRLIFESRCRIESMTSRACRADCPMLPDRPRVSMTRIWSR